MRPSTNLPVIGIAMIIALGAVIGTPAPAGAVEPTPPPASEPGPEPDPEPMPASEPTTPAAEPVVAPPAKSSRHQLTRKERIRLRYARAVKVALRQRHDRYVAGRTGPNAFDCSGLVRFAYRQAGIGGRLGGGQSARAMLQWARKHDKTRRRNPQKGDVVIWGNGRHAGIWIGKGRVISALNPRQGIRITRLHALGDPFTAFIRTRP